MKSLLCLAFGFWCGLHYTAIMTVACPASTRDRPDSPDSPLQLPRRKTMIRDFDFAEHRTSLIIGACTAIIAGSLATGGADRWQTQQATKLADQAGAQAQARAESIYQDQGCIAQAINGNTRTSNFAVGDVAVDPMSITTANPSGSPIAGGYVCSTDGSVFRVENGTIAELIGTSPKIRDQLIAGGFAQEAQAMQQRAQTIYRMSGGQ